MIKSQNHHFVPQFYLREFGFKKGDSKQSQFIYEYDKNSNIAPKECKSVKEVCTVLNHNSVEMENGEVNNIIEEEFSKIESNISRIMQRINPQNNQLVMLSNAEKKNLALFISLMFLRNPACRDGIEEMKKQIVYTGLDIILQDEENPPPQLLKELIDEKGLKNIVDVKIKNFASLDVLRMEPKITDSLIKYKYYF